MEKYKELFMIKDWQDVEKIKPQNGVDTDKRGRISYRVVGEFGQMKKQLDISLDQFRFADLLPLPCDRIFWKVTEDFLIEKIQSLEQSLRMLEAANKGLAKERDEAKAARDQYAEVNYRTSLKNSNLESLVNSQSKEIKGLSQDCKDYRALAEERHKIITGWLEWKKKSDDCVFEYQKEIKDLTEENKRLAENIKILATDIDQGTKSYDYMYETVRELMAEKLALLDQIKSNDGKVADSFDICQMSFYLSQARKENEDLKKDNEELKKSNLTLKISLNQTKTCDPFDLGEKCGKCIYCQLEHNQILLEAAKQENKSIKSILDDSQEDCRILNEQLDSSTQLYDELSFNVQRELGDLASLRRKEYIFEKASGIMEKCSKDLSELNEEVNYDKVPVAGEVESDEDVPF